MMQTHEWCAPARWILSWKNGEPSKQKDIVLPWYDFGISVEDWLESIKLELDKL